MIFVLCSLVVRLVVCLIIWLFVVIWLMMYVGILSVGGDMSVNFSLWYSVSSLMSECMVWLYFRLLISVMCVLLMILLSCENLCWIV